MLILNILLSLFLQFNFVRGKRFGLLTSFPITHIFFSDWTVRYRIRIAHTGSLANFRFSIDHHPLTVIEADGTLLEPMNVAGVELAVAQRYSVVVQANATANADGLYWMRSTMLTDMFTYNEPGQNTDIRGIIRYTFLSFLFLHV